MSAFDSVDLKLQTKLRFVKKSLLAALEAEGLPVYDWWSSVQDPQVHTAVLTQIEHHNNQLHGTKSF